MGTQSHDFDNIFTGEKHLLGYFSEVPNSHVTFTVLISCDHFYHLLLPCFSCFVRRVLPSHILNHFLVFSSLSQRIFSGILPVVVESYQITLKRERDSPCSAADCVAGDLFLSKKL